MPISLKSLAAVGGYTLLSRVLGFLRDLVLARLFGADVNTDAFLVAFKLPNLLRRMFVEGTFSLGLVPILTECQQQHGYAKLQQLIARLAARLIVVSVPSVILGMIIAPGLVMLFAPGFDEQRVTLTTAMLRITIPYLPLIIITAFAGAILNSQRQFWVPAFTPVILNLSMIAAALWLTPYFTQPIIAVAWGVLIAGVIQLALQIPFLARLGLLSVPRFVPNDPDVQRIFAVVAQAVFSSSIVQLNLVFDTLLVSFLPVGSISWLYYGNRLIEFPQGILGSTLGTVILPQLAASYQHTSKSSVVFSEIMDRALRGALLLGLPASVALWILAEPIMVTLFYSEEFNAQDVAMSAASLQVYSLGLPAYLLTKVFTPGYYARHDTRTPVRIAMIVGISNITLSLLLIWPLAHLGLAWSSTLAACLNAVLLWRGLVSSGVYSASSGWLRLLMQIGGASAGMGITLILCKYDIKQLFTFNTTANILQLLFLILVGTVEYFTLLFLFGLQLKHLNINSTTIKVQS